MNTQSDQKALHCGIIIKLCSAPVAVPTLHLLGIMYSFLSTLGDQMQESIRKNTPTRCHAHDSAHTLPLMSPLSSSQASNPIVRRCTIVVRIILTKGHLQLLAGCRRALGAGRLLGEEVWREAMSVTGGSGNTVEDGLLWWMLGRTPPCAMVTWPSSLFSSSSLRMAS